MKQSNGVLPEPCSTMKLVAVPDFQHFKNLDNKTFRIIVNYPVEYTEIKDERVENMYYDILHANFLCTGIYLGESVGKCWWIYWILSGNIIDAAASDYYGYSF